MRIVHIGNVNCNANGVGQVIKALSSAQTGLGHEVMTLTARYKQDELASFIEVHRTSDFINLINKFHPDIFVFHSLYIWEYIKFYKILRNRGIPYLLQLHGALSEENYKKSHLKKVIANALFYNKFIRNARRIIYLNQGELEKSIVKRINPKSVIIPNGCETPNVSPCIRRRENGRIEFLYLGRIEIYHKALDVLVEAIEKIRGSNYADKIHFTFYGIGEDDHLSRFKEMLKPIADIATFKGPAFGEAKEMAYQNADYFILTSRSEGMPMAVLEALSYGRPCFVTPATNVADIIRNYHSGYVSELDVDILASDIIKAFEYYENNKEALFRNSLSAAHDYHWEQIAKKTIGIYSDVINQPN